MNERTEYVENSQQENECWDDPQGPREQPRLDQPTKLKEQQKIPFTHHISACAHESCTVFLLWGH